MGVSIEEEVVFTYFKGWFKVYGRTTFSDFNEAKAWTIMKKRSRECKSCLAMINLLII